MLCRGPLSEKSVFAPIGKHQDAYSVALDIRLKALELVEQDKAVRTRAYCYSGCLGSFMQRPMLKAAPSQCVTIESFYLNISIF